MTTVPNNPISASNNRYRNPSATVQQPLNNNALITAVPKRSSTLQRNSISTTTGPNNPKRASNNRYRNFQCDVCGKTFKHKNNLSTHKKIHTDQALKCTFCQKKFARPSNLKLHIRIHTNERPYQCSYCEKSFKRKQTLIDHNRIHTGEKPYQCSFCEKSFKQRILKQIQVKNLINVLTVHNRIHTGEKPYQCPICHKAFRTKSNCTKHKKTHWTSNLISVNSVIKNTDLHRGVPKA